MAELSARFETGGPGPAADARESKIVQVSKKNRALTLSVERERAEKLRALAQLKSAQVRLDTLDSERTETEVERACREVVEEASRATEAAQNELAATREKWKQASARAERFSGQKAFIKTENDRLKVIIRREVGEHVDFGRLDDEIAATGGKKGRAATIRDLNMRLELLKMQLAEANDALAAVAAGAETLDSVPTLEVGGEEVVPRKRLFWTNQKTNQKSTRSERNGKRERTAGTSPGRGAAPPPPRRRVVSAAARDVETARTELAAEREDAALLAKMNRNLETEVRSLLEKVVVLKDKSDHDDRLVDALRDETRRLRSASAEDSEAVSEVSERARVRASGVRRRRAPRRVPLHGGPRVVAGGEVAQAGAGRAARARQEREPRAGAGARVEKRGATRRREAAFSPAAVAAAAGGGEPPSAPARGSTRAWRT